MSRLLRRSAVLLAGTITTLGLLAAPANAHHLPFYYGTYGSALACDMNGRSAVNSDPHWVEWWCNRAGSEWDLWVR